MRQPNAALSPSLAGSINTHDSQRYLWICWPFFFNCAQTCYESHPEANLGVSRDDRPKRSATMMPLPIQRQHIFLVGVKQRDSSAVVDSLDHLYIYIYIFIYTYTIRMADSASRAQRAAAMEEKRRRLEELKKRKSRRNEDTAKVKANASANLDNYIDDLLAQPGASTPPPPPSNSSGENKAATAAVVSESEGALQNSADNNVIAVPAPAPAVKRTVETFCSATQTEQDDFPEQADLEPEEEEEAEHEEKQPGNDELIGTKQEGTAAAPETMLNDPKLLSAQELEKEITSAPFSSFINTASKKVERLLGATELSDLLVDYIGETDDAAHRADNKDADGSRFLSSRQVYECAKWTAGRDVTDMDWSPLHREFILSTYHMPSSATASYPLAKGSAAVSAIAPNDTLSSSLTPRSGELQSDGLALVWNTSMPTRPEHIFTCGSPVTAGRFHPSEPTLVMGGCESGQLVVWDVRAGRLPVQKSALTTVTGASSKGHTHPICSMEIIEGNVCIVFCFF